MQIQFCKKIILISFLAVCSIFIIELKTQKVLLQKSAGARFVLVFNSRSQKRYLIFTLKMEKNPNRRNYLNDIYTMLNIQKSIITRSFEMFKHAKCLSKLILLKKNCLSKISQLFLHSYSKHIKKNPPRHDRLSLIAFQEAIF